MNDANNTMPQLSVYSARGMLFESTKATWLYGTASEHSVYYQYSFYKAANIHAGMIQTESPYYQPNPNPPAPFDHQTLIYPGDPDFAMCQVNATSAGCDSSWAVKIERSANITFAGAGLYTWFTVFDESCVDPRTCQKSLIQAKNNGENIIFFNLVTIGATSMISTPKGDISAIENASSGKHPWWSHISLIHIDGDGFGPDAPVVYIDPTIWSQSAPTVQCSAPCIMVLPTSQLPSATTITFEPYITSLEVGYLLTLTMAGKVTTTFVGSTTTTTLSIPPLSIAAIEWWNVAVDSSSALSGIVPTPSIVIPPFTITDQYPPGITQPPSTRTINLPPYPFQGDGLPGSSSTYANYSYLLPPITYASLPTSTVSFVTTPVPKPTFTIIDGKPHPIIPCTAWFFFVSEARALQFLELTYS
jgi:hypothetical protein